MRTLLGRLSLFLLLLTVGKTYQVQTRPAPPTTNVFYTLLLKGLLRETVPYVSVQALKSPPAVVLLDARTPREYAVSHLRGARWVGFEQFSLDRVRDLPKDARIVVYCSVGYRSQKIGEKLQQAGFTQVRNLYGGLFEWVNEGNPAVTSGDTLTTRVHAFAPVWGIWLQRGQKVYR